MNIPDNLMYTKSHEWVQFLASGNVRVGITDHAQDAMGDLVFADLPEPDDTFEEGEEMAVVESVKAVSDVYAPVAGKVVLINEALLEDPAQINDDPYGSWFVELEAVKEAQLLSPKEYEDFLQEEE